MATDPAGNERSLVCLHPDTLKELRHDGVRFMTSDETMMVQPFFPRWQIGRLSQAEYDEAMARRAAREASDGG